MFQAFAKVSQELKASAEQASRSHLHIPHQQQQLQHRLAGGEDEGPRVVDWEWVFAKIREDKECSPQMAGLLLAAGLSGQSMSVNPYDLHEFLSLYDKLVVVALLLGTSVAYRGTANVYVSVLGGWLM